MPATWLIISGFTLLGLLLYLTGVYMLWMPRQCAVLAEVFAASGNFPSFIPRSVRGAVLEMRTIGLILLGMALLIVNAAVSPEWSHFVLGSTSDITKPNLIVLPALLVILAGYMVAMEAAPWVVHTLDYWVGHPLVPRRLIPAFPWVLRLAGFTLILFGAGLFWFWLGMLIR